METVSVLHFVYTRQDSGWRHLEKMHWRMLELPWTAKNKFLKKEKSENNDHGFRRCSHNIRTSILVHTSVILFQILLETEFVSNI